MIRIGIVLDKSSSMAPTWGTTLNGLREFVDAHKRSRKAVRIRLTTFSWASDIMHHPETTPGKFSMPNVIPRGNTALYDAVVASIRSMEHKLNSGDKAFIAIITDGKENASITHRLASVRDTIKAKQNRGWTFVFMGAGDSWMQASTLGIAAGNTMSYEPTHVGTQSMMGAFRNAALGYTKSGGQQTNSFFTPPALKGKDIAGLKNVTFDAHVFVADIADEAIADFVKRKTGKAYAPGVAFYAIVKAEKVGPDKQIVLQDKASRKLYHGKDARDRLGLPDHEVKIASGDAGQYWVYVQSSS